MKFLIIAEKPNQAEKIKNALESKAINNGKHYEGDNFIIAYAVGHLFNLKENTEEWSLEKLPIAINNIEKPILNYEISKGKEGIVKNLFQLLKRDDLSEVVCATDYDVEGEVIYGEIIDYFELKYNKLKVKQTRLLIKDTTVTGLKKQFEIRKDIEETNGMKKRGYTRALIDFYIGINMSRAVSLKTMNRQISVGRVQIPTLKLIVDRFKENKVFKPTTNYEIKLITNNANIILSNKENVFKTSEQAESFEITNNEVERVEKKVKSKPPKLYVLTDIQGFGNKVLGISTSEALEIMQSLYNSGYVTYPRTECANLTEETAKELIEVYGGKRINENTTLNNFINKQCIGTIDSHEGITPTSKIPKEGELGEKETVLYEQIKRIFLSNLSDNAEAIKYTYTINIDDYEYKGVTHKITKKGYLEVLDNKPFSNIIEEKIEDVEIVGKEIKEVTSKAPELYTENTLLKKMKNIHNEFDDKELSKISKSNKGIGTSATRAEVIKTLFKRQYIENKGKKIIPTKKGVEIYLILEKLKNPIINLDYTARLETKLIDIEKGDDYINFLIGMDKFISTLVENVKDGKIEKIENANENLGKCPKCKEGSIKKIITKNKTTFYPCSNKECDFNFPVYGNFTPKDIENMLNGKKSTVKKKKNKEDREYKVKYFLKGKKIEMEFYNANKKKKI